MLLDVFTPSGLLCLPLRGVDSGYPTEPQRSPGAIPLESENYPELLHTFVEQICISLNNLWPSWSIIENLLSYFSKLNLYKSYQPLRINEIVLGVTAHVLLVYCPQASNYMLSRPPASPFLPSNFQKSSETASFPPREIPTADVTSACLKQAVPLLLGWGKCFPTGCAEVRYQNVVQVFKESSENEWHSSRIPPG